MNIVEEYEKYLRNSYESISTPNIEKDVDKENSNEYNPLDVINKVIDSDFDSSVFENVDDSELPLAKNWLEFCNSPKFLGIKPFPKQIKFGLEFFSDYCPYCSDPKIMSDLFDQPLQEIYEKVQLLEHGKCPKCGKTRQDFIDEGKFTFYNELAGCAGQRAGKSVFVAMCANYQLHRFLKLPNPSYYFNLLKNQTLHMTFVAITYKQADDTLWQPFRDFYDSSPWFRAYNELLDYYASKHGVRMYVKKDTFVLYEHKRLTCYASGPDKRKLRGLTRFFSSIDELGWFHGTDKAVTLNADEVCKALERSLRTIRSAANTRRRTLNDYHTPDALFVNISSPSAVNDKIMRLVKEDISTRYNFHLATWEMNPTITREDLNTEYQSDPVATERDYGANPPLSDTPFISNPEIVRSVIKEKRHNGCKYKLCHKTDRLGNKTVNINDLKLKKFDPNINYILGVDTGYTKNAFAVVLQHYDLELKSCLVDLIIEIRPSNNVTVSFPNMFKEVILPIAKQAQVALVAFDKWQSINYEQELHENGLSSERYSLKTEDFSTIRSTILNKKISIPNTEIPFEEIINTSKDYNSFIDGKPITHFVYQILTVRDIGRTVTKGLGTDDDIFRAWCLGIKFLFDDKYKKFFQQGKIKKRRTLGMAFGKSTSSTYNINGQSFIGNNGVTLGSIHGRSK